MNLNLKNFISITLNLNFGFSKMMNFGYSLLGIWR